MLVELAAIWSGSTANGGGGGAGGAGGNSGSSNNTYNAGTGGSRERQVYMHMDQQIQ